MDATSAARAVAPHIDRIRIAIARRVGECSAAVAADFGVGQAGLQLIAMLRNLPPNRTAAPEGVAATFMYQPDGFVATALEQARAAQLIIDDAIAIRLTEAGVAAVERIHAVSTDIVMGMWADQPPATFDAIAPIIAKALDAAAATGGAAFDVMWPLYTPAGTPVAARVAESLTALRFHRFDVHVAAWRAAGLTVAEIQALEPGDVKDAVEADTNERAAAAYATLNEQERQMLLDGLTSLPASA